ncbi:prolyl 4-hydroxylase subunit alpha-1 [Rhipicephalus sanguineus]|uniref:prolyl 4-hydroxylase subunit alpha-1 n=1 Tax=Rhipicephalus sanguineus TaxID=34632 RepID=UPI001893F010|nr:prolyl 4-hydroxylase subunit alpha-1 [Rhipicephalus sanguineus]
MQESIGTEHTALEDGHLYVLLQERKLAAVRSHYEAFRITKPLRPGHSAIATFLFHRRLTEFTSYGALSAAYPYLESLPNAFLSPSSRQWWPTHSDVIGAAIGICKLQHLYDIPVDKMAAMKSKLLPPASPEDFAYVARGCPMTGKFGTTSAWNQAALAKTSSIAGAPLQRLRMGLGWLQTNDQRWRPLKRGAKYTTAGQVYPSPPEIDIDEYKTVCVREGFLRPSDSTLLCKMSTNFGDPRLILQPLKLEVLSLKPRVVVISDFLSTSEVNYIRSAARRGFVRAGIYSPENVSGVPSWKRIGKVSWLWDSDSNRLQRLSQRIAVATGLSLESAEAYQVANYGLGGHYTPHMDAHRFDKVADHVDTADGNRLATVLMYLSNVASGGATAFVELGVAVKPRVGDALFWYDVEPYDGSEFPENMSFWHQKRQADPLTRHVGCPVLWGSKWIVTKWIHERSNVVVEYNTPG